jgi:PLP dependent protein
MTANELQSRLQAIQDRIARAAAWAGRRADEITLIAVSKTHPADSIRLAYETGIRHFGENRVQDWEEKQRALGDLTARWHLIGHLQSNKAGKAARLFHSIDSLDDLILAKRLDRARSESGNAEKLRVLIEVNLGNEETKSGVLPEAVVPLAREILSLEHLHLAGLMSIPPFLDQAGQVRPYFRQLRELSDATAAELARPLPVLSMGMSHDFEVAIEEGATEVRVGTALFGQRGASNR